MNYGRGTRAVGIECVDDTIGREKGITELIVARASRLVVLSAGAFGSASVLERSGIGSKDVLMKNNVQQLVDLPGVGEHYMGLLYLTQLTVFLTDDSLDHNMISLLFSMSDDAETMDDIFWGTEEEIERMCAVVLISTMN